MSDEVDQLTVEMEDAGDPGPAHSYRARRDRVEDRLNVGRRLADHAEDLAGRRLLLLSLNQLAVPRLELS